KPATTSTVDIESLREKCYEAMNDDLNTPIVISYLFEATTLINKALTGDESFTQADIDAITSLFKTFMFEIMGMVEESKAVGANVEAYSKAVDMLLELRQQAKANKDWATSDKIRNELQALGFEIKDGKEGTTWRLN
ncbi:MAG: DALR domain-containing protein, partial [Bacteroidales bacterium]